MYGFTCRHFSKINDKYAACPFIIQGFGLWKKCTGENQKDNRLTKHKNSLLHLDSTARYKAYMETKLSQKTVTSLLKDDLHQFVKKNREYIKIIVDILRLTAIQNIGQRGHRESNEDSDENRRNFLEILNFLKKYSEILEEKLDGLKTQSTLTTAHITLSWKYYVR